MSIDTTRALQQWSLEVASCDLAARRENIVFRVVDREGRVYALRYHRPGYRTAQEIQSELQWMEALAHQGINVPQPITTSQGEYLSTVGEHHVDMLNWLDGAPMGSTHVPLALQNASQVFFAIGKNMAQLHTTSDQWKRPPHFSRPSWSVEGLIGEHPLWGRFWENPMLTDEESVVVTRAREKAQRVLAQHAPSLDYGLIHADLVRENLLIKDDTISFIDFDDSGFGFRVFDIATTLFRNSNEPDYSNFKAELLKGYRTHRPIDTTHLDLFILLRAFTYLGWTMERIEEPGMVERSQRSIVAAIKLAKEFNLN